MSSDKSAPNVRLFLSCGSATPESETGRAFLQERIALFAKVVFLLTFGFYLLGNLLHYFGHTDQRYHFIDCHHNQLHLAAVLVLGFLWAFTSRGKHCPLRLRFAELSGTFLACLGFSLVSLTGCEAERSMYPALLGTTNTLMARAILVPSSPKQTFWLGTAASVPVLTAAYLIFAASWDPGMDSMAPWVTTSFMGLWCAVAVVGSAVGSRVIYGLRKEVRQARRLGQYTLEEKIGAGGMGEVYKARHAMLRRPTAVKLLRGELAGERNIERFEREVQLTSMLTHPNTIAIYDYGRTPDGLFYYAMEYLSGMTLDNLVQQDGPQPAGRVLHILEGICSSLREAHGVGLIHRDIKGANVMLCERGGIYDVAKLVDFGLVKDLGNVHGPENVALSAANVITGTPLFLSPEAIRSPETVDARSDLYSVGVLGYYLLTGQHVFEGKNYVEICGHHLHTEPIPLSLRTDRSVPRDLEAVILSCLRKNPEDRPRDTQYLLGLLRACRDAGTWTDSHAAAWWRDNEVRIKKTCSLAPPTADSDGRAVGAVTVLSPLFSP